MRNVLIVVGCCVLSVAAPELASAAPKKAKLKPCGIYEVMRMVADKGEVSTSTGLTYNAKGLLTGTLTSSKGDPNPTKVVFTYDKRGQLVKEVSTIGDDPTTTTYERNEAGAVLKSEVAHGLALRIKTEFSYDPQGRKTKEVEVTSDGESPPSTRETTFAYDAAGKLSKATYSDHTVQFTYNERGLVLTEQELYEGAAKPQSQVHKYDASGNRIETNYVDFDGSLKEKFRYDPAGNLLQKVYDTKDGLKVMTSYSYVCK